MHEYTTDIRELDNLYLTTIANVDYYEERWIVKRDNGRRSIVGKASDWPLIAARAENAELTALLTASERRSVEADCHVVELLSRETTYRDHIAALEQALADTQPPPQIPPVEIDQAEQAFVAAIQLLEAPDDGKMPCDHPGCDARVKPRGLLNHKRLAHGWACVDCGAKSDKAVADPSRCKACVRQSLPIVSVPMEVALGEPPWRCASCATSTHARSLQDPSRCIKCVVEAVAHTNGNGHLVAA